MITFGRETKRGCSARSGADRFHDVVTSLAMLRDLPRVVVARGTISGFCLMKRKFATLKIVKNLDPCVS